jgi:aspartate carbamoyltransferase regulatory subunit
MRELKVDPIKSGTVIDHIPASKALSVLSIIRPKDTDMVTVGINFASKKYGKKDIVKIENRELTEDEVNSIALIAPSAKISIIREFEIVKKTVVQIPDKIVGLAKCSNPNCVTNHEAITTRFFVVSKQPVKLRCEYCERIYDIDYIKMR